jgi:HPt (histidine-containing phosphotransfer) domain-containing protein
MKAMQDPDLPSGIEGLDIANGMRRVLGKKSLYLWMLRKYISGQQSATAEIIKALDAKDWNSAERLAHTLKGVSGNIGATGLQLLAKNAETAIKERLPRKAINARLDELQKPLAKLIAQLQQQLPEEQHTATVAIDHKKLISVCGQLEALLVTDDSAATDLLDANTDLLRAAFPLHYRLIDDGIRSLNFEIALKALREATAVPA